MSRQLLAISVVFAVVSVLCVAYIVRQLLLPMPMPIPAPPTRTATPGVLATTAELSRPTPGAWSVVVARNVFSPMRTEAAGPATPGVASSLALKPNLYGVVLREDGPIAYLEDPLTKRVGGYRIGDAIAGGIVKSIGADNVVIARPDGRMDVQLHDVTRVRTAQPGLPLGQPATPIPGGMLPGTVPGSMPNPAFPTPTQPNASVPTPGAVPGRRPPPLLRRAPTGPPTYATPQ